MIHRVCLVGLGRMGGFHLKALIESERFRVVAVVDPAKAGSHVPGKEALVVSGSLDEVDHNSYDVAIVAAATEMHYHLVRKLLLLGKGVLVEKPAATTGEEARQLMELAATNGVSLSVGHIERCNPVVATMDQVLKAGVLGRPLHALGERMGGYPKAVAGGNQVILDLAIHELDVFQNLFGDFAISSGKYHCAVKSQTPDFSELQLAWNNGMFGSVQVSWLSPQKRRALRVTGTQGVAEIDYIAQTCHIFGDGVELDCLGLAVESVEHPFTNCVAVKVPEGQPLQRQLVQWDQMLRGEENSMCRGEALVNSVERLQTCLQVSNTMMVSSKGEAPALR